MFFTVADTEIKGNLSKFVPCAYRDEIFVYRASGDVASPFLPIVRQFSIQAPLVDTSDVVYQLERLSNSPCVEQRLSAIRTER